MVYNAENHVILVTAYCHVIIFPKTFHASLQLRLQAQNLEIESMAIADLN